MWKYPRGCDSIHTGNRGRMQSTRCYDSKDLLRFELHSRSYGLTLDGKWVGPSSTFPRAILPKFTLTSSTLADKYQDFVNTWTVNPMGTGLELSYVWLYDLGVDGPLLPLGNKTSFVFNYWEAMPEKYRIKVIQTDLGNINFEYSVTSPEFNVLSSCSTPGDCRTVVWTLSNDPGTTPVDCTDDNLIKIV